MVVIIFIYLVFVNSVHYSSEPEERRYPTRKKAKAPEPEISAPLALAKKQKPKLVKVLDKKDIEADLLAMSAGLKFARTSGASLAMAENVYAIIYPAKNSRRASKNLKKGREIEIDELAHAIDVCTCDEEIDFQELLDLKSSIKQYKKALVMNESFLSSTSEPKFPIKYYTDDSPPTLEQLAERGADAADFFIEEKKFAVLTAAHAVIETAYELENSPDDEEDD